MTHPASSQRTVVTGMGIISAIGQDTETFFRHACMGVSGISAVRGFPVEELSSDRGAEIHDFDVKRHFQGRSDLEKLGRCKQLALSAAVQCMQQACYPVEQAPGQIGVALGYTQGESKLLEACCHTLEQGKLSRSDIDALGDYPPQSISQQLAGEFGFQGPVFTLANACSASSLAIGAALDLIRLGEVRAMLVGGADAFSHYGYAGFSRLGAISRDVPRPFSIDRGGMVPGEGAAMILVESLASARERNATILAEIIGYGESCDAHHITQPNPDGIAHAIRAALGDAGIHPGDVSFISAHGTGTQASDRVESVAFVEIFGTKPPPVTAVKSVLGHAMGAGSAMECVTSICALQQQISPPTMNYLGPDPECTVDCVPNRARPARLNIALKTASAFGGNNAAVLFQRWNSHS